MSSIDDLIRESLPIPEDDSVEAAGVSKARAALAVVTEIDGAPGQSRARPWVRRVEMGIRLVPALVVGALVLAIGVGAVLLVHARVPESPAAHPPAAAGLISRLAVLRRPQSVTDKLPASVTDGWSRLSSETEAGRLLPELTRLVFAQNNVKLYLAVVAPRTGPDNLWTSRDGDQVTLVEVTPAGVSATQAVPADALADADIVALLSPKAGAAFQQAAAHGLARWVSIIPDGVANAHWLYSSRSHSTEVNVPVRDNVAVSRFGTSEVTGKPRAAWYAADGHRIGTNHNLLKQALAASQQRRYRQLLTVAEGQHDPASAEILKAFAVFSFDSQTGTRLRDGLVISKPRLNQLPLGILGLINGFDDKRLGLDYQDARRIQAPSGLSMYILPGRARLCVAETGIFEIGESPDHAAGAGYSCSAKLADVLGHGTGISSGGRSGQINYGIVPNAHPVTTITIRGGRLRRIRPQAGVYIVRS